MFAKLVGEQLSGFHDTNKRQSVRKGCAIARQVRSFLLRKSTKATEILINTSFPPTTVQSMDAVSGYSRRVKRQLARRR